MRCDKYDITDKNLILGTEVVLNSSDYIPTVDAIPIEWIKKWCGDEPYWSNLAMHLIEDWEKENEID